MTARVIIIEDDAAITALLTYNLVAAGFEAIAVHSGEHALESIAKHRPDLVIIDWMLPGVTGIEICRALRARPDTRELPIIMLTARALPQDKLHAFDAGVDDYIAKPFSVSELIARIHGLLRRAYQGRTASTITVGELQFDELAHQVTFRGAEVLLTPVEFRLFKCLIERSDRVLSRTQLIERVWHNAADVNERTVDIHIGHLRRSLINAGAPDYIRTVRGAGYMLTLDEE